MKLSDVLLVVAMLGCLVGGGFFSDGNRIALGIMAAFTIIDRLTKPTET